MTPTIRFVYKDGVMHAYLIGPKCGVKEVDYHEAWLAVATGRLDEEGARSGGIEEED